MAGVVDVTKAGWRTVRLQALRSDRSRVATGGADLRAADLLAASHVLTHVQDSTVDGFDTVLRALAIGLNLRCGLLWWAAHHGPWTVRAVHQLAPDWLGRGLPEALAGRRDLLDGRGAPMVLTALAVDWGMRPVWALPFGCPHDLGGTGLAVLGVGPGERRRPIRNGERLQAETLAALASAAAGTLAVREGARRTSLQAVQALAQAVDAKDHYTHLHSRSVAALSAIVARRLGLPPDAVERARMAGLLHDVGKIGIPDAILNKPGPLDAMETLQMRQHPALGDHITKTVDTLRDIAPLVRGHHERWDGQGYPDRLKGEFIPLEARIVTAVDAYDAMTADRVYRPGRPVQAAAEELLRHSGTQFDPRVVEALVAYVRERMGDGVTAPPQAA